MENEFKISIKTRSKHKALKDNINRLQRVDPDLYFSVKRVYKEFIESLNKDFEEQLEADPNTILIDW